MTLTTFVNHLLDNGTFWRWSTFPNADDKGVR